MSLAAGGAFLAALVVTLAVADDETTREARQRGGASSAPAPAAQTLSLRSLQPADARIVRDREHGLDVAVPLGWRVSHGDLTPHMGEGGTILTVATFNPGERVRRGCGWPPDLPQTPIGSRDALLHVEEQWASGRGTCRAANNGSSSGSSCAGRAWTSGFAACSPGAA